MKSHTCQNALLAALLAGAAGCGTQQHTYTNPSHPGPAVGQPIGAGIGLVGGNIVGAGVAAGEGVVKGVAAPFDKNTRVVRRWRTETTADGRTIQVPEDIVVDAAGRPIKRVSPK